MMFPPQGDDPREWTSIEHCFDCDKDTLHTFIEFVLDGVVESECSGCQVIRVHADDVA